MNTSAISVSRRIRDIDMSSAVVMDRGSASARLAAALSPLDALAEA
ncbi:hypothetical protein ABZZ20_26005 [Streptomyces sp. NPDC006430]